MRYFLKCFNLPRVRIRHRRMKQSKLKEHIMPWPYFSICNILYPNQPQQRYIWVKVRILHETQQAILVYNYRKIWSPKFSDHPTPRLLPISVDEKKQQIHVFCFGPYPVGVKLAKQTCLFLILSLLGNVARNRTAGECRVFIGLLRLSGA